MYLKTSLLLTALALSVLSAFAGGRTALQDSVKKVTVRVTASEKKSALNFDSLINSSAKVRQPNTSGQHPRPRTSLSKKTSSKVSSNTSKAGALNARVNTTTKPAQSAPSKTITKSTTDKPASVEADNHEEETLQPVPINDDEEVEQTEPGNFKTSRAYLWVGFMLIVIGAILGILFGKTALLVSIAGMVFVIIGYTI
ncbi:MAG TPA: hypothetical protein VGB63_08290 [Pedobacter sp.]|jgi:uncharacterized membrane protein